MEDTNARLLLLKAQLFSMLALLGALMLITSFLAYRQMEAKQTTQDQGPFCGTEQMSAPLNKMAIAGKELFNANCAACHNKNMVDNLTGPALHGVEERWAAYPRADLYNWIRHSQQMIKTGHPRAQELWQRWNHTIMNDFSSLTDEQIEQLLAYIASR